VAVRTCLQHAFSIPRFFSLLDENGEVSTKRTEIPSKTISFLCDEFSTKSACILRLATSLSTELEEV